MISLKYDFKHYYHNPDKRIKAGKAARTKAKKEYDWPVIEQRWLDLAKVWEKRHVPRSKNAPRPRGGVRMPRKK